MKDHWIDTKHDDDGGNEKVGDRPQDGRKILENHVNALRVAEGEAIAWDDVTNAALNPELVAPARQEEMR